MNIWDILKLLIVIGVFVGIFFGNMIAVGIQNIKDNWPKYKCNPMIMPFAGYLGYDTMENFTGCVANIMEALMSRFLSPVFSTLDMMSSVGGNLMKDMNKMKTMMPKFQMMNFDVFGNITGIFTNIMIKFQKMIIKLKDLVMKIVGAAGIIINITDGLSMGAASYNCGPNGDFLRAAAGKFTKPGCCASQTCCFKPTTPILLKNGTYKQMKDIEIGDKLEKNIEVIATMKIKGDGSPYYKIYSSKIKDYIYVTGTHLIKDNNREKFIPVEEFDKAEKTKFIDNVFSCLVTSNHNIPIGEYDFWDWED